MTVLLLTLTTAHAQSYGPPTYSVGDTWTFSNGREVKIVNVDENGSEVVGAGACWTCWYRLDRNLTVLEVLTADGKPFDPNQVRGFTPVGPGWKYFDFPLELKKGWRFSAKGYYKGVYGSYYDYTVDSAVSAYEDVKIKAGTFRAYRIDRVVEFYSGAYRGQGHSTTWFAPDTKSTVKYTSTSTTDRDWELVSYSLK